MFSQKRIRKQGICIHTVFTRPLHVLDFKDRVWDNEEEGGGTKGSESKLEAAVDASSADQNVTRIASPSARKDEGEETT